MEVTDLYTPVGCNECFNGYKGRVALHEVLIINQDIRDGIVNNKTKEELRHLIYDREDMNSILQDGLLKVMEGLTSFEEVLRVIDVDDDLGEDDSDVKDAIIGRTKKEVLDEATEEENTEVIAPLNNHSEILETVENSSENNFESNIDALDTLDI